MTRGGTGGPCDEEGRRKIGAAHRGKKLNEEHRKNISQALKGRPSPMKGKNHSAATCERMAESHRGLKHSAEHRAAISAGNVGRISYWKGKKQPEEMVQKRSQALKKSLMERKL